MPKRPPLPSVDISKHGRIWKDIPVENLEPGDVVPGKGLVESVNVADGGGLEVEWMSRERDIFRYGQKVTAFVKAQTLTDDTE